MNCNETQTWLLRSESPALPPPPLAEHIRRCGACQRVQRQLLLVETQLQSAPLPLIPPAIRADLMSKITVAPVVVPATRTRIVRRRRRVPVEHIVGYLSAAAASVIIGAVLGYGYAERHRPAVAVNNNPVVNTPVTADASAVAPAVAESVAKIVPEVTNVVPSPKPQALSVPPKVDLVQEAPMPMALAVTPDVTVPMNFSERPAAPASALADAQLLTDDELLARLVETHTQVAGVITPQDRLTHLASLSDVLWTQTIKEAEASSSTGNLDWLGDAYAAIVENELPALARELPADQKDAAQALAVALDEHAIELSRMLSDNTPKAQAEVFRQLQASAQASSARLTKREKEPASPKQRRSGSSSNLLPMVIEQTVAIARESNPIERADCSTVVAEGLAKDILVTSLRGEDTRASALGAHFGRVLEQGVAVNLKRIDTSKATYQQNRRYQQVVARTQQSILFLQQSLEAAPPGARDSLALAMQQGGLAQLVPPPGPTRRVWIWIPANFRWPPPLHHRH